jgi:hypothetical protein
MTPNEFVTWMKGFVEAANSFNITPKQWDSICEHLEKVKTNNEITIEDFKINSTADISKINYTTKTILND